MSNPILYVSFNEGNVTNSGLGRIVNYPDVIYGSDFFWEIHLIKSEADGTIVGADVSKATAWHAAIDTDFTQSTIPMARTLADEIDASKASEGIITVRVNAYTDRFLEKVDGRQAIPAFFELRGLDAEDKTIYCFQFRINARGAVDAEGGEPVPVTSGTVTLNDVYAIIRQKPLLQYSADGSTWSSEQLSSDIYTRVSIPGGEWSDEILLPSGAQGPAGPAGPKGDDGSVISGVTMTLLASDAQGYATFTDGVLDFGIPSGAQGAAGPQGPQGETGATGATGATGPQGPQGPQGPKGEDGDAIKSVTVTTLPDTAQASASFENGVLALGIPSGTPGSAETGNAVQAVAELPVASLDTVGKAYLLTTDGHTWLGTEGPGSSYDEQVTPQGYELKAISGGTSLPALSAGTLFTSGGTYNTYTWWSAEGTNGETYYLGTYVDENSTAIFPMVTENVHPSAWTSSTKTGEKAWMIDNWRGHQTYMVELPAEDTWIYQDDADYGYHHLEFDFKVEDGAVECPSFTGFRRKLC